MSITNEDLIDQVRSRFDKVARHMGLRGPTLMRENMYFYLAYFGEEVGLQVLVEFFPFSIFAMLFRKGPDDEVPLDYTGAHGESQKIYLEAALEKLNLSHAREKQEIRRLDGDYRNCEALASILADLVERTWLQIIAHRTTLFPPVKTPT